MWLPALIVTKGPGRLFLDRRRTHRLAYSQRLGPAVLR
jgi:hypothetical protein